jgi:hypothetical protein
MHVKPKRALVVAIALVGLVVTIGSASNVSAQTSSPAPTPVPEVLSADTRGSDLFSNTARVPGGLLQSVADANERSVEATRELASDSTVWFGKSGRAYFVDPRPVLTAVAASASSPPIAAAAPDVFALHSRPGSAKTIYLDFNGESVPPGAWKSVTINAAPYDTDSSPGTFSSTERAEIESIWSRVSEDYAPFDIDVTTAEPTVGQLDRVNAADLVYGTRAVVTSTTDTTINCVCGGVAYIGVFDIVGSNHEYFQPAWIFQNSLSSSTKPIAEAVSHEVGHNLNLVHDGTIAHDGFQRPITTTGTTPGLRLWGLATAVQSCSSAKMNTHFQIRNNATRR